MTTKEQDAPGRHCSASCAGHSGPESSHAPRQPTPRSQAARLGRSRCRFLRDFEGRCTGPELPCLRWLAGSSLVCCTCLQKRKQENYLRNTSLTHVSCHVTGSACSTLQVYTGRAFPPTAAARAQLKLSQLQARCRVTASATESMLLQAKEHDVAMFKSHLSPCPATAGVRKCRRHQAQPASSYGARSAAAHGSRGA